MLSAEFAVTCDWFPTFPRARWTLFGHFNHAMTDFFVDLVQSFAAQREPRKGTSTSPLAGRATRFGHVVGERHHLARAAARSPPHGDRTRASLARVRAGVRPARPDARPRAVVPRGSPAAVAHDTREAGHRGRDARVGVLLRRHPRVRRRTRGHHGSKGHQSQRPAPRRAPARPDRRRRGHHPRSAQLGGPRAQG